MLYWFSCEHVVKLVSYDFFFLLYCVMEPYGMPYHHVDSAMSKT